MIMTDERLAELLTLTREVRTHVTTYKNSAGEKHRRYGPAVSWADGGEFWYWHGALHSVYGPAIIWSNGSQEWHWHGQRMTQAEWGVRSESHT